MGGWVGGGGGGGGGKDYLSTSLQCVSIHLKYKYVNLQLLITI